jgi:hypothetical protein
VAAASCRRRRAHCEEDWVSVASTDWCLGRGILEMGEERRRCAELELRIGFWGVCALMGSCDMSPMGNGLGPLPLGYCLLLLKFRKEKN